MRAAFGRRPRTSCSSRPRLLLLLEGKTPLSEKDEAKKKEDIAKAKKPAQKKKAQEKWAEKEGRVDDQLARAAAIEAAWLTGAADVKAATAVLQKQAKISDPKLWKMWVHANLALAMRGDKAAIGKVAKLIGDPKEDIRKEVIQAIGASYDMPGATARGVADAAFLAPLLAAIDATPDKQLRQRALHAAAVVRSFD